MDGGENHACSNHPVDDILVALTFTQQVTVGN